MTTMVLPKGFRLPPPENITLENPRIVDISGWSNEKLADTILEYEEYNFAADAADAAKAAAATAATAAKAAAAADVAERNRILHIVKEKRPIYYKLSGGLKIFLVDVKEGQMTIDNSGFMVPVRVGSYMTLPKGLRIKASEYILELERRAEVRPVFTSSVTGKVMNSFFTDSSGYVTLEKGMSIYIDGWSNEKIVDTLVEHEKHN